MTAVACAYYKTVETAPCGFKAEYAILVTSIRSIEEAIGWVSVKLDIIKLN